MSKLLPVETKERLVTIQDLAQNPVLPRITLSDVARKAGVSKSTAAQVCRGTGQIAAQTREAVLKVAQEMNYVPNVMAQRLSRGKSLDLIGIVCPALAARTTMMKNLLVQRMLARHNFEVPLYCYDNIGFSEDAELETIARLCQQHPRAILCSAAGMHEKVQDELIRYQHTGGILVCSDDPVSIACDNIIFDREHSSYEAARYLLEQGHRRIGFYMVEVVSDQCEPLHQECRSSLRFRGFERALNEFSCNVRPEWLFAGNDHEESGAALAERFLNLQERPTAICIVNEHVASAFINVVQRAGLRVPEDVSIVSHDDMPAARYSAVPLTTVSQPVEKIASDVAQTILSRLAGSYTGAPRRVVLRGELIVRESVAPPAISDF
jgi:DNA-binding LacI/PurR family transcriptional regulator